MAQRPNTIRPGVFSTHRLLTGAPVAADPAISSTVPNRGALLNTSGYESVVFAVLLDGGVAPTVDLEFLIYDPDADACYVFATQAGVTSGTTLKKDVHGLQVFVRIAAVGGNPTQAEVRVTAGLARAP